MNLKRQWHPSIVGALGEEIARIERLTNDELRREIAHDVDLSATIFLRIAVKVVELERRGESIDDLRLSFIHVYRRIGNGQTDAEAAVKFFRSPVLLKRIETIPLPDQRAIAAGPIPVVEKNGDKFDVRMRDPLSLTPEEIRVVIAKDHLRSAEEQKAELRKIEASKPIEDEFDNAEVSLRFEPPMSKRNAKKLTAKIGKSGVNKNAWMSQMLKRHRYID